MFWNRKAGKLAKEREQRTQEQIQMLVDAHIRTWLDGLTIRGDDLYYESVWFGPYFGITIYSRRTVEGDERLPGMHIMVSQGLASSRVFSGLWVTDGVNAFLFQDRYMSPGCETSSLEWGKPITFTSTKPVPETLASTA